MPITVRSYQDTPNPNALKCLLSAKVGDRPRSYFSPADAQSDPLAVQLFAIPGITNLLIHPDWITLGKSPDATWKAIKTEFERVLRALP